MALNMCTSLTSSCYYTNTYQLWQNIPGANYSARLLPLRSNSVVQINSTFMLMSLLQLSNEGRMSVTGFVYMAWLDEGLAWDPNHYGLYAASFPVASIWTPQLYLLNTANENFGYSISNNSIAYVQYNGITTAGHGAKFDTSCEFNLLYFPFDSQTCDLLFSPLYYTNQQFVFSASQNTVNFDVFVQSSDWTVSSTEVSVSSITLFNGLYNMSVLNASMTWVRSSSYYVSSLLYPTALITILTFVTLFLPAGSLEKSGVAAVLVLGTYVLQQVVSELMPSMKEPPYCMIAIEAGLALSGVVFVTSVISIIMHETTYPMSMTTQFIIAKVYCTLFFQQDDSETYRQHFENVNNNPKLNSVVPESIDCGKEKDRVDGLTLVTPIENEDSDLRVIRVTLKQMLKIQENDVALRLRKHVKSETASMNRKSWRRLAALINFCLIMMYTGVFIYITVVYLFPVVSTTKMYY